MVREGVLRDEVVKDGRYITVEVYGIVRKSHEPLRLVRFSG